MGLRDKIFNKKSDEKSSREVGPGFDKDEADRIFDALDKHDAKEVKKLSRNMQKEVDQTRDVSSLIKQAKSLEKSGNYDDAIELYKKAIVIMPDAGEAYVGLANIYHEKNDADGEIDILKKAVRNIDSDSKIKNDLIKRLKELNN